MFDEAFKQTQQKITNKVYTKISDYDYVKEKQMHPDPLVLRWKGESTYIDSDTPEEIDKAKYRILKKIEMRRKRNRKSRHDFFDNYDVSHWTVDYLQGAQISCHFCHIFQTKYDYVKLNVFYIYDEPSKSIDICSDCHDLIEVEYHKSKLHYFYWIQLERYMCKDLVNELTKYL